MSNLKRRLATLLVAILAFGGATLAIATPASAAVPIYGGIPYGPYSIQVSGWSNEAKCLDITGNSYANGAPLQLYDCLGTQQYNQQFYFWDIDGSPYYYITPSSTWKCLDVRGVSIADYAVIQQYDCLGDHQYNQMWDVWFGTTTYKWHIDSVNSSRGWAYYCPCNGTGVYQWGGDWTWTFCSGNGSCVS